MPNEDPFSELRILADRHGLKLPNIYAAAARSKKQLETLRHELLHFGASDCSIVAFGSLARLEMTAESDLDWSLLIDGAARSEHKALAIKIGERLGELKHKKPNPAGAFGNLTFSHDLVHSIGGESDSNKNTTRRILLLLESTNLGHSIAWERVVRGILERYFTQEPYGPDQRKQKRYFPRFLVNDVVRFWRTMAVDYAAKVVDRAGNGWALRNAKLRLSRKLIFSTGLLLAYEVYLNPPPTEADLFGSRQIGPAPLIQRVFPLVQTPPLEILARAMLKWDGSPTAARDLFESYDEFLGLLDDKKKRKVLDSLPYEKSIHAQAFNEVREIGHRFQRGLDAFFLDGPKDVRNLTRRYAIF